MAARQEFETTHQVYPNYFSDPNTGEGTLVDVRAGIYRDESVEPVSPLFTSPTHIPLDESTLELIRFLPYICTEDKPGQWAARVHVEYRKQVEEGPFKVGMLRPKGSKSVDCTPPLPVLTVTRSGDGDGTVTSDPAGIDCGGACAKAFAKGTAVALTATPAADSEFVIWRGDCIQDALVPEQRLVTVDEDATCDAEFRRTPFQALWFAGRLEIVAGKADLEPHVWQPTADGASHELKLEPTGAEDETGTPTTVTGGGFEPSAFPPLEGSVSEDGEVTATGTGEIAGIPDVSVELEGTLTAEGELDVFITVGFDRKLPGGQPIAYRFQGVLDRSER